MTAPRDQEIFSPQEIEFLSSQTVGRLATLTADGAPVVVPVGFEVRPGGVRVVGHRLESSAKWHNLRRDARFGFVVDEGVGRDARGVQIRGAAVLEASAILLVPRRILTWGIVSDPYERRSREVGAADLPLVVTVGRLRDVLDPLNAELTRRGRRVVGATSAEELTAALRRREVAAVVLGGGLPETDRRRYREIVTLLRPDLPVRQHDSGGPEGLIPLVEAVADELASDRA